LRALFASMTDVILILDADGRYIKIPPTNTSSLYKVADDLIHQRIHDIFPQDIADRFVAAIQQALELQSTVKLEYSLAIGDGVKWFDAAVSPLLGSTVIWVARDITDRKDAEHELRSREALFQALITTSPALTLIIEPTGNIRLSSPASQEILGYLPAEM